MARSSVSQIPTARIVVLMPMAVFLLAAVVTTSDVFVAPTGSDSNVGTSPGTAVATLERARDVVRSRTGKGGVDVHVAAGLYTLKETLMLGPDDSDVRWLAEGKVVVSGGHRAPST